MFSKTFQNWPHNISLPNDCAHIPCTPKTKRCGHALSTRAFFKKLCCPDGLWRRRRLNRYNTEWNLAWLRHISAFRTKTHRFAVWRLRLWHLSYFFPCCRRINAKRYIERYKTHIKDRYRLPMRGVNNSCVSVVSCVSSGLTLSFSFFYLVWALFVFIVRHKSRALWVQLVFYWQKFPKTKAL